VRLEEQESQLTSTVQTLFYTDSMNDFGRILVGLGLLLLTLGGLILLLGKIGLPFGRLPGDIVYRGKNTSFYFPLASSILLSILLSLVFYLLSRFRR
jgi:hypothetical protein